MSHLLQIVLAGLSIGAVYALVAVGFAIVHRGTGAVNFAQGEYVMLGGVVAGVLHEAYAWPLPVTVLVTLAAGVAAGVLTEFVGVRFTRRPTADTITIATIGVAVAIKAAATILTQRRTYALPAFSGTTPLQIGGAAAHPQTLWNLGLVAVAAIALTAFFRATRRGVVMRAAADDQEMVSSLGVSFRTTTAWSFALAALLGAAAGVALTPLTLISFDSGTLLGLKGFAAAMLGGLGSMAGAVAGGFVLGLAEAVVAGYGGSAFADVVAFALLLGLLFVRPTGLVRQVQADRV